MEIVDFSEQFAQQEKLDLDIAIKHNVSYDSTRNRRILALLVEIGELANETRCFKYWSNKKASEKSIILEEYADGMHFYLSLGVDLNVKNKCFEVEDDGVDIVETFHQIYTSISTLK